jgi:SSS family solute:Na+ symporter
MNTISIISFIVATGTVAFFTIRIVRGMKKSDNATEEYFTGGRALAWPVVAGSLLLTNLSTEQLVGLNGAVFGDKALVGIAWEALAAFSMIATALIFLPKYLASGFTTTPAFLEKRFDKTTRSMVSGLFLFGYVTVLLPVVLYTGSLAMIGMFDLNIPLWLVVATIGSLGSAYAIFGGLKSVAVSDTLNGIGLLIGGLAIPFLALAALGGGSFFEGLATLGRDNPQYLAVLAQENIDGKTVTVPWPTLFTGMMFIQVFYWSTNQVIVQRAMAARSLAEGQKGVLFASGMKLLGPIMLCLPGIIALHMPD